MAAYDPFEDDQLGQPPPSVPPGDPRAGLYAYLAQQAAIRQQGQSVPSYEQVQKQAKDNADRSAANAFGAQLQNSASMMGTLNGKRSDYSGPAETAKALDSAGQEELTGDYQALAQRNRDVATEGAVYKDLSNPDVARARLYATLGARNNLYDSRRDIADKNNQGRLDVAKIQAASREKIAGMAPDSGPDNTPSSSPTGNWHAVYPKDGGEPYMLDSKTGQQKPLNKNFMSKADKEAAERASKDGYDANGDAIDPDADEALNPADQKIWDQLQKDTNPSKAPRGSDFGVNQKMISAADRIKQLGEQGKSQPKGLDPRQIHEMAIASASLVSGGNGGAAQSTVEALVPNSVGRTQAAIEEWLTSNPTGTDQQKFVDRMLETADRERHLANEKTKNTINDTYQGSTLWDRAPNRMDHSYYRKMGDDAAYDEQGRYIQEPYQHGAPPTMAVGQSPVQLQQSPGAKAPGGPQSDTGPVANPAQYEQDLADKQWGAKYGYTFEQAKAIRDKRRAALGGQ